MFVLHAKRKYGLLLDIVLNAYQIAHLKKIEGKGVLLEFTFSYLKNIEGMFGIVDVSGIRLVGSIFGRPLRHGMEVTMIKCGINSDGSIFYHFKGHKV